MQENEVVEPKYGEKIISEFDVEKTWKSGKTNMNATTR